MSVNHTHLKSQFDHLFNQIRQPAFLEMRAIGGEVPFYISTYAPQQQVAAVEQITLLVRRLQELDIRIRLIDLYDLSLEIIQREDELEDIFAVEQEVSRTEFMETMQSILDVETEVIPAIVEHLHAPYDVLFLTGVGQVFPFIRTHSVLHNLQPVAKTAPTVMFFPGEYNHSRDGSYLKLFNLLKNDNYYRAFHIDELQL